MTAKQLIKKLEKAGWRLYRSKGSHHLFRHPEKTGSLIVPVHPGDLKKGTEQAILKQAGL